MEAAAALGDCLRLAARESRSRLIMQAITVAVCVCVCVCVCECECECVSLCLYPSLNACVCAFATVAMENSKKEKERKRTRFSSAQALLFERFSSALSPCARLGCVLPPTLFSSLLASASIQFGHTSEPGRVSERESERDYSLLSTVCRVLAADCRLPYARARGK